MFDSMLLISFHSIPAVTAGKYRASKQTGTVTHPIPLWKKFRVNSAVSVNTSRNSRFDRHEVCVKKKKKTKKNKSV